VSAHSNTPMGYNGDAMEITLRVPDMQCDHCKAAVTAELEGVSGVRDVEVDLGAKHVVVRGDELDDDALRAAIAQAGYEAA
jgi:copper chaperone